MNTLDNTVTVEFTDEELHRLQYFRWKQHQNWVNGECLEWLRLSADELDRNKIAKNRAVFERLIPALKELK